jgi:cytochrome d ubiquinol oxidase subunit I
MDALAWHRFQFAFTITYHYLFPQLTMGLALLILVFKTIAFTSKQQAYDDLAQFWARIFAINFAVGVVTGIPMEFQFGTNWGRFSTYAGGVVGLTLALESMFAFFAESAFLGLFLFGKQKLTPLAHLGAAFMIWLGSWCSGYFVIVANAFMQHPVGYAVAKDGTLQIGDVWALLTSQWAFWQYCHTMSAAVITGSFVVTAVGAYWCLMKQYQDTARLCLRVGVIAGLISCILQLFPTGDMVGKLVARYQRPTLAAMEGKFDSGSRAELALLGQPNMQTRRLENPIAVPWMLSYLSYGSFGHIVEGMNDIPKDQLPDNVALLYYVYHIMVGLGTIFTALMGWAAFALFRRTLFENRLLLWLLMLAFPFPYIATTAGWMSAELGRQPWLVYGLLRTTQGTSPLVSSGDVAFSLLGFMGLYTVVGLLFVYLVLREIAKGPSQQHSAQPKLS